MNYSEVILKYNIQSQKKNSRKLEKISRFITFVTKVFADKKV